ncbi:hypothetical protein SAMN05421734_10256 [Pelagirhabdus alkalitolerans]|uniref:Uncharacterized protein n=1 Tax=Pelagirhabdus alkalitolerans TaxID=1612202 RepID=A0A1G6H064_9BACI|nr:hypothetical protein [Pelagirhabdus alkalitolerans]SDB87325.1 hypothetical protein SAMN05421734_10256 [Pelagirhabdus alkalitolerans]
MSKKVVMGLVGISASVVGFVLADRKTRANLKEKGHDLKMRLLLKNKPNFPIDEAGDPLEDQIENADMVSEGSQYGVEYYNRIRQ